MSRIMTSYLMRQQSRPIIHESYWIELWRGGGGRAFSFSLNTPTDSRSRNF